MSLLNNVIQYTPILIYMILTIFLSYLSYQMKKSYEEYLQEKRKKEIADTTCKAIQQLYPKSTGKEKLKKATERLEAIFKEKELQVSKLELRVLIESLVHNIKQPSLKLSKERKSL